MADETIICSRCGKTVNGKRGENYTAGFYDVTGIPWSEFANPGEVNLCDECMWVDERYIQVYGKQHPINPINEW